MSRTKDISVKIPFHYELEFIDKLQEVNIPFAQAYVSILFYFREFSRPESDIVPIIKRFSPQLTDELIKESIIWLKDKEMLNDCIRSGYKCYTISEDYAEKLEVISNIPGFADRLKRSKEAAIESISLTSLGLVGSEGNYASLLSRLKSAHSTIKYPMLCSTCYEDTANILEAQAQSGVHVQLLIGNDSVVKKIRGNSSTSKAKQWKKRFKHVKNVEIRTYSDESVADLCSSFLIDGSILRYVVYDYESMPTLDGFLIEVSSPNNVNVNLVKWFDQKFDEAWKKARFSNIPNFVRFLFSPFMLVLLISIGLVWLYNKYEMDSLLNELFLIAFGACVSYLFKKALDTIISFVRKISQAIKNIE